MPGIPTISALAWNEERALARANRALSGRGIRLHWTPEGIIIAAVEQKEWPHPWQLNPVWDGTKWTATVRPGFVDWRDVCIDGTPLTDLPAPALAFNGFRDPAAPSGISADDSGNIVQGAGEGYPQFFDALGVQAAATAGIAGSDAPDPTRNRLIRASDVVLITPRVSTVQTVSVADPLTDAQTVTLSTTINNANVANSTVSHRLVTETKWVPTPEPTDLDRLLGTDVEPQTDEILIATLYLVSPPGADDTLPPDSTWTPYVLYAVFWNLAYAPQTPLTTAAPDPLTITTGLAFGIGDALINALLSPINDFYNEVTSFLSAANYAGIYWNPGGHGMSTLSRPVLATSVIPDNTGFDPRARRLANQTRKSATVTTPTLNPSFPYLKTPFDPFHFDLDTAFDTPATP